MNQPTVDLLQKIHNNYYQFTAAERKVADYVLLQPQQVQFMSITQLADECGTAEATISRFCRDLELKGFNAFKIELARCTVPQVNQEEKMEQSQVETQHGRSRVVGISNSEAVWQTLELLDPAQVEKGLKLMEAAPNVLCFGAGGSMLMAMEFAHLFSTVTGKFHAISDSHRQMSAVATAGKKDVVVLFSYSGSTKGGLQLLELANSRGIRSILITRYPKSPAASLATVVLRCGSNEGPFQFGSVPAKVAQLTVMDLLFQEYCHRNPTVSERNIQAIASALSDMHI